MKVSKGKIRNFVAKWINSIFGFLKGINLLIEEGPLWEHEGKANYDFSWTGVHKRHDFTVQEL